MIIQRGAYLKIVCVWFVVDSLWMDIPVVAFNFSGVRLLVVVIKVCTLRRKILKSSFF